MQIENIEMKISDNDYIENGRKDMNESMWKRHGFNSHNEYQEYLAKRKGFKSRAEYEKQLVKQRGYKRLDILEKEVIILDSILDSTIDRSVEDNLFRPMEEDLFIRQSKFRECSDLYSRISKI
jgi:hypothetical protein